MALFQLSTTKNYMLMISTSLSNTSNFQQNLRSIVNGDCWALLTSHYKSNSTSQDR